MKNINKGVFYIIIIFALLYFALIWFVGLPRFSQVKEKIKSLSSNQMKLNELQVKRTNLEKFKKDETRIEKALEKAKIIVPQSKNVPDFIVQLEGGASETGNVISQLSFTDLSFTLSIKGDFNSLLSYIKSLESLARFNTVSSLTANMGSEGKLETKIEGQIYAGLKPKTPPKEEISLDYKKLEELESFKYPGTAISPTEAGYGRENPFAPY